MVQKVLLANLFNVYKKQKGIRKARLMEMLIIISNNNCSRLSDTTNHSEKKNKNKTTNKE